MQRGKEEVTARRKLGEQEGRKESKWKMGEQEGK